MTHGLADRSDRDRMRWQWRGLWPVALVAGLGLLGCPSSGTVGREDGGGIDVTTDGEDPGGDSGGLDAIDPGEVDRLTVDPTMATLRVTDPAMPLTQAFTARAHTRDGRDLAVPATWSVDRTDAVTIDGGGLATTTNTTGGDVVVTARYGAHTATATLRVMLDVSVSLPGTPPGTEALFPPGATPTMNAARTPSWLYPANETVFPQNLYRVLFQWRGAGNDRFRVTFESERGRVVLFTDGVHATCTAAGTGLSCFEPTLEIWRYIAGSNPRASVSVTIDGAASSAPGMFYRSAPLTIGFSRGPVPGAIYYWSTTAAGVRRGTISDATPQNFLTPNPREQTDGQCVACHTLSRRGNRLAADVGGENLWVVEVSPTSPPPRIVTADPAGQRIASTWATFSPDETRVVSAARGVMTLRRADNGAAVNTLPLGTDVRGTQPDWSPDGTLVAFTTGDRRTVNSGRIATIEAQPGDMWGAVRVLAGTGMRGDTNNFPSFSWDSQWIAYVRSTGSGHNDVTSDLWLMRRDGGEPRALTRANTVINDGVVTTATVQDNMPTWAPSGVADDYAWVAFSSTRDYGGVLSPTSRLGRKEQIWVAAIDLARAPGGADPSYPAFRLPAQDLDEDTHRPFWAEDRVRPDPDAGVPDAGPPDAGTDAGSCVGVGNDCTSSFCCPGLVCDNNGTETYTCHAM